MAQLCQQRISLLQKTGIILNRFSQHPVFRINLHLDSGSLQIDAQRF
jgi:hypothetical protein